MLLLNVRAQRVVKEVAFCIVCIAVVGKSGVQQRRRKLDPQEDRE